MEQREMEKEEVMRVEKEASAHREEPGHVSESLGNSSCLAERCDLVQRLVTRVCALVAPSGAQVSTDKMNSCLFREVA